MALPAESLVVSCMAPTVARPPQSNASATARTAGVQRGGFCGTLMGCPLLETIKDSSTISAAPVSSTQPIPAADSALRAPGDIWRAAATSGRSLRPASNSRAWAQSALAQPFDRDRLSVEFEVDQMTVLAAPPNPDRRREYGRDCRLRTVGCVAACHVNHRKDNPQQKNIPHILNEV